MRIAKGAILIDDIGRTLLTNETTSYDATIDIQRVFIVTINVKIRLIRLLLHRLVNRMILATTLMLRPLLNNLIIRQGILLHMFVFLKLVTVGTNVNVISISKVFIVLNVLKQIQLVSINVDIQ